jgi:pSer/pThr/pTyr-binding forkhead associated (FHA) protein
MNDIQRLVNKTKLRYEPFREYIMTCSLRDYLITFRFPFLVGREIYEGQLSHQTASRENATFQFQPEQHNENPVAKDNKDTALSRSIFILRCEEDERLKLKNFTVGRHARNDITIVDYAISKEHAVIKRKDNHYVIIDRGSTNGTLLNGDRLEAKQAYVLKSNDAISFGRFGFILMRPISLFINLRLHLGLEHSLKRELIKILKIIKFEALLRVARRNNIKWKNRSKENLLKELSAKIPPLIFLEQLF